MSIEPQIETTLSRALAFVLAAQSSDGAWTDWNLPPGPAQEWATANVGWRLSALLDTHREVLAERLERAADWLLNRPAGRAGWGYNRTLDGDADTTAQALLFLAALGRRRPPDAYAFLCSHQQSDGGFATYLPNPLVGSWGRSHAEVTPIALMALQTGPSGLAPTDLTRGLGWVCRAGRSDGLWNSFWWSTPLVATAASLTLLKAVGARELFTPTLADWTPRDSFETELLVSSTAQGATGRLESLTADLAARQEPDGSWQGSPVLRITSRTCDQPWDDESSTRLYADSRRLHTTAAAICGLARARAVLASGLPG